MSTVTARRPSSRRATVSPDRASSSSSADLYPSPWLVLFWASVAALRVSVVCATLVTLLHPLVVAAALKLDLSSMGVFFTFGLGTHTIAVSAYIIFFALCERYGWLRRYKLHRPAAKDAKNEPGLFWKAVRRMVLYQGLVRVAEVAALWQLWPYPDLNTPLPPPQDIAWHFFTMFFLGEGFNYGFHRLQHEWKWLNRHHKTHHEFVENETISAEYSDFVELITFTAMSYISGRELPMTLHFVTILWKVAENQEVHSGYSFRGTRLSKLGFLYAYRTEFHEFHHLHPGLKGSYGKPFYFDYWLRTCDDFLIHQARNKKDALNW